jgi:hypothetical protein
MVKPEGMEFTLHLLSILGYPGCGRVFFFRIGAILKDDDNKSKGKNGIIIHY